MTTPRWARTLLRRVVPPDRAEDVLGDLEEVHRDRVERRGPLVGSLLTAIETLDVAAALLRQRRRRREAARSSASNGRQARRRETSWFSWLDFKLALRMLVKYPGLTLVGGLAIAFAITIGAAFFQLLTQLVHPTIPLDDGQRIVGIRIWDAAAHRVELQAFHDFATWRQELQSVEELGAFRTLERNLITEKRPTFIESGKPISVAEISASAFRLTRVPPLLGRGLVEADEKVGAPPVVVLGHGVWQRRFGGDPDIIGQIVRLGRARSTVVGVMPRGFEFPIAHRLWIPLRHSFLTHERRQGPAIRVFGRLAPGTTLDQAQAELTSLGLRAAADFPGTHEHLRPEVMPYAQSILNVTGWISLGTTILSDGLQRGLLYSTNLFFVLFLALVCANVALLMFARAATREGEIVVRNALGASRCRIVLQLFIEALVLGAVAAVVGLTAAGFGLRWGLGVIEGEVGAQLPFWIDDRLAPTTVIYAGALTVLGAVVTGVLPALKVTGRRVERRLRQAAGGGRPLGFGRLWTAVIVVQVAVTVALPATAFFVRRDVAQIRSVEVGFPAEEYLSARLEMDQESASGASSEESRAELLTLFHTIYRELQRRLEAEPAVIGVTFADRLPRMYHPHRRITLDDAGPASEVSRMGHRVGSASVDVAFFDALGIPILSGRGFHSGDLEPGQEVVIVNQAFAKKVLGGSNPIGRRLRYLYFEESGGAFSADGEPGPWYEIVGVVRDMGMAVEPDPKTAGFYHPLAPGGAHPLHIAVQVRGDPQSFAPRLRAVASALDPTLRLDELVALNEVDRDSLRTYAFWFRLTLLMSAIALLLSTTGIYSVMAFTVSRRTREIGIRVALGSDSRRVVAAIFSRPLLQVGLGVVAGGGVVALLARAILGALSLWEVGLLVAYAAVMMGVCLLACIVPTQRALRVEPTDALRAEG